METIKEGNNFRKEMKEYTDLYCSISSGGCGEVFWCPKSETYGNYDIKANCPNCDNTINIYESNYMLKLPGSISSEIKRNRNSSDSCDEEPIEKKTKGIHADVCMVYLEKPPDTMVLPCEDVVVCKQCSYGLKDTPDKNTCVQCRRPIEHVLD
jgi:hypothetical protein